MAGGEARLMPHVTCGNCGTPIPEAPSLDPAQRQPCPQCGSRARSREYAPTGGIVVSTGVSAATSFTTYPQALLDTAQRCVEQEEYSAAVAVAHMACGSSQNER